MSYGNKKSSVLWNSPGLHDQFNVLKPEAHWNTPVVAAGTYDAGLLANKLYSLYNSSRIVRGVSMFDNNFIAFGNMYYKHPSKVP